MNTDSSVLAVDGRSSSGTPFPLYILLQILFPKWWEWDTSIHVFCRPMGRWCASEIMLKGRYSDTRSMSCCLLPVVGLIVFVVLCSSDMETLRIEEGVAMTILAIWYRFISERVSISHKFRLWVTTVVCWALGMNWSVGVNTESLFLSLSMMWFFCTLCIYVQDPIITVN